MPGIPPAWPHLRRTGANASVEPALMEHWRQALQRHHEIRAFDRFQISN
jgi:hypothetical protein